MEWIRTVDWSAVALGLPIGIGIGMAMGNVAFGIPIGLMFGIAFASESSRRRRGEGGGPRDRQGG